MKVKKANILAVCQWHCWIGEGPMWWGEKGCLIQKDRANALLVDIYTGDVKAFPLEQEGSAFGLTESGRLMLASEDRICLVEEDGTLSPMHERVPILAQQFNDGKVGPDGRFYVGTIYGEEEGGLYCLDEAGDLKLLYAGLGMSNGLDWSLDTREMYLVDTASKQLLVFPFDRVEGIIGRPEVLLTIPGNIGGPDGMCIDQEGYIWCALWGEGYVARIDPAHRLVCELIHIPAPAVASCAFVGEAQDRLAVTTASYPNSTPMGTQDGYTFILDVNAKGRVPYRFRIADRSDA